MGEFIALIFIIWFIWYLLKVITQLWHSTSEGIPTQIKNTRTMALEDANETWFELLSNGWELVEHQINDDAA